MSATLRVNRTRPPLAETSIALADVGAVEVQRVVAGLALDGVAAVAGVPLEACRSPPPSSATSAPWLPSTKSSPAPPSELLGAGAADQRVVAGAAVDRDGLVEEGAASIDADLVVAAAGCDVDRGEGAAVEREVGRAVDADVDVERCWRARPRVSRSLSLAPSPVIFRVPASTCAV